MADYIAIATWPFGRAAVIKAAALLAEGRPSLDAAVAGAQVVEDDPTVHSVGYGGLGDAVGDVTLDACVMDGHALNCGAVAGLRHVRHAAAVARRVMEKTPHLFLVGEGATQFAIAQGFPLETLHTPESIAEWEKRRPKPSGHDTVTVLARDRNGSLGGVCSTSGLAHKLPGRVGDSPIIGAGLYVDNQAGAAGATGVGEEIIRAGGCILIVEAMRGGQTPQQACEQMVRRINALAVRRGVHPASAAFIALDTQGRIGAACTERTRFQYAVAKGKNVELLGAPEIPVQGK
jgi:isoaspartyl peptidase/L-asparaginase-like protein (Ntn-hydrolase superfamily)